MTSTVLTTYDPVQGTTFSVSECPDCGAGSSEPCVWACSSNWEIGISNQEGETEMTYSTWHFFSDTGRDDFQSLDEAIAWALNAVRYCPTSDDEDNFVSVYCKDDPTNIDRVAVAYPGMVVVNEGHGTVTWPSGWNETQRMRELNG